MVLNNRLLSLKQEAKAGFDSLIRQGVTVSIGLLIILLLTRGNPPEWLVSLSFFTGIVFVAWQEKQRITRFEKSTKSKQSSELNLVKIDADLRSTVAFCVTEVNTNLSFPINGIFNEQPDAKVIRIDPSDPDLSGAKLSGAKLSGAKLSGAKLIRTDLSNADLSNANLSNANLSDANLSFANLSFANLSFANLSFANLSGAKLIGAKLIRTDLSNADLSFANLSGANLSNADLSNADLSNADLSGVKVNEARFKKNLGLTEEIKLDLQQRGAIFEDSPGDRSGVLSRS